MEEIDKTFDEIQNLAEKMLSWPEDDRITLYRLMDSHLLKLEGTLARNPDAEASQKLDELKLHLIMLAHLYEPDDHTDEQHYAHALESIKVLRTAGSFAHSS